MAAKHLTSLFALVQAGIAWDKFGGLSTPFKMDSCLTYCQNMSLEQELIISRALDTFSLERLELDRKGTSISTQRRI